MISLFKGKHVKAGCGFSCSPRRLFLFEFEVFDVTEPYVHPVPLT